MPANTAIMWFRQDLRLSDNPALLKAIQTRASTTCLHSRPEQPLAPRRGFPLVAAPFTECLE